MGTSIIMRPLPATYTGTIINPDRLGTPDPKEVAYYDANANRSFTIDLGADTMVGAFYMGGVSGTPNFNLTLRTAALVDTVIGAVAVAPKRTAGAPRQYLARFTPQLARYAVVTVNATIGLEVGFASLNEVFEPTYGHEWGAGRFIIDTGLATRNRAGGFGIEAGAIVTGWDFTLGDLTEDEREVLFDMLRKVGETSPVIVCEDPDQTADLDARLHYGLFQRLEKYERQQLGVTRWSLKVEDWR